MSALCRELQSLVMPEGVLESASVLAVQGDTASGSVRTKQAPSPLAGHRQASAASSKRGEVIQKKRVSKERVDCACAMRA